MLLDGPTLQLVIDLVKEHYRLYGDFPTVRQLLKLLSNPGA